MTHSTMRQQPIHVLRDHNVKVLIWSKKGRGTRNYGVSISSVREQYRSPTQTPLLGIHDLLIVIPLLQEAHQYLESLGAR